MRNYHIYSIDIPQTGASRRDRETKAKETLLHEIFGGTIALSHDEHGAPSLPEHPASHISISHCSDTCVIAISDTPIGIDIERARPQLQKTAHKFLTDNEIVRYHSITDRDEADLYLLKMWTAKEAAFKAAHIPDLVISEIEIAEDFATATARGTIFRLTFPLITAEKVMSVAEGHTLD